MRESFSLFNAFLRDPLTNKFRINSWKMSAIYPYYGKKGKYIWQMIIIDTYHELKWKIKNLIKKQYDKTKRLGKGV